MCKMFRDKCHHANQRIQEKTDIN